MLKRKFCPHCNQFISEAFVSIDGSLWCPFERKWISPDLQRSRTPRAPVQSGEKLRKMDDGSMGEFDWSGITDETPRSGG